MKVGLTMLVLVFFASPVMAADKVIQFSLSDWTKTLHKIELDQQETKLLRQQNKDLKQLVTLSTEQVQQCEQLTKSYEEMGAMSDELRRSLEERNTELQRSITQYRWIVGGQAVVIAVLVWLAW